jgi:hypothetical protein
MKATEARMTLRQLFARVVLCIPCVLIAPIVAHATTINFDDVVGSEVDITNRYAGLGVTLNGIANPVPLAGVFPAPAILPTILGGVTTWTDGFPSATSPRQVAVAAPTATTGDAGDGGILISFAFDVTSVSLVGNDLGPGFGDDESVTLTAYDAGGAKIGQVFSVVNLLGFDRTPATISTAGIRYVAFNYTDTQFGFYAIDDLTFESAAVPEPGTALLVAAGIGLLILHRPTLRRRGPSRS